MERRHRYWTAPAWLAALCAALCAVPAGSGEARITHSFLAAGNQTRLIGPDGAVLWSYPRPTRDGWVLPNGNFLLALAGKPGGVVEVTRENRVVLEYQGTQDEVDTVQRLPDGNTLLTEAGPKPRILELDPQGKVVKTVPLTTQTTNTHVQQRMTRKLPNGNYLVPHALEQRVKEYTPEGKVVWETATPNWAFTAIRLADGNTLIGCTLGDLVIEVNPKGETVWKLTNDDFPDLRPLKDCCGVQRLPNGNTVVTSYRAAPGGIRLTEVTRDKKIVWTYRDDARSGIHHFQILDTNGVKLPGTPLK